MAVRRSVGRPPLQPPPSARRLRRVIRPSQVQPPLSWIVHYARFRHWETILDVAPGSLHVRRNFSGGKSGPWRRRSLALARPHAVAFQPDGTALIADTDNDRLVVLDEPARGRIRYRRSIGGVKLCRPHHILHNPHDQCLYAVDAHRLFRLPSAFARGECWQLSAARLGYARALTLLGGKVHIVASSRGAILRIDDFDRRRLTEFASPGKARIAPAGSWRDTGFVLNDVAELDGWYYGTNYFTPDHASQGDPDVLRFVRWRTWADFRAGRWVDLSACLPAGLVPYFLTVMDRQLYVAGFCHADHDRDGIFVFNPSRHP